MRVYREMSHRLDWNPGSPGNVPGNSGSATVGARVVPVGSGQLGCLVADRRESATEALALGEEAAWDKASRNIDVKSAVRRSNT